MNNLTRFYQFKNVRMTRQLSVFETAGTERRGSSRMRNGISSSCVQSILVARVVVSFGREIEWLWGLECVLSGRLRNKTPFTYNATVLNDELKKKNGRIVWSITQKLGGVISTKLSSLIDQHAHFLSSLQTVHCIQVGFD